MRIDWMDEHKKKHTRYVDFISVVLTHDAQYVVDCLHTVIERWSTQHGIESFLIWTDQGKHFVCEQMFASLMRDIPITYAVNVQWNRFVEHHGKSAVDAHFSLISRWLKEAETQHDKITTTDELITVLNERAGAHKMSDKIEFELYCPKCVLSTV